MGMSTNAMLLYGYNLGNDDNWELEGAGEYGELPPVPWYDPENEEGDIRELMMTHLLAEVAGFTETDWKVDGYFDRERAAMARLGVTVVSHCSGDYPMFVLCAADITAYRGDARVIDPAQLAADPVEGGWDAKLEAALTALRIRPTQRKPAWLLCSYWG